MVKNKEYRDWLQAHIAMEQDLVRGQSKERREFARGHIALLELELKDVRRELRAQKKKGK